MGDIPNIDTQVRAPELSAPRHVDALDEKLSEKEQRRIALRKRARAAKKKSARRRKPSDSSSSRDVDILA